MDCAAKAAYVSAKQARTASKRIARARGGERQREYFCPLCSKYHLTTGKKDSKTLRHNTRAAKIKKSIKKDRGD